MFLQLHRSAGERWFGFPSIPPVQFFSLREQKTIHIHLRPVNMITVYQPPSADSPAWPSTQRLLAAWHSTPCARILFQYLSIADIGRTVITGSPMIFSISVAKWPGRERENVSFKQMFHLCFDPSSSQNDVRILMKNQCLQLQAS